MTNKPETFRLNLTMSKDIVDFYQALSKEYGLPRSSVMVIALKDYMDKILSETKQNMI